MKKREWKMTTDHFELMFVWHEPEASDIDKAMKGELGPGPERFLMIGPVGATQLARIDGHDAEMILPQLNAFFGSPSGMMGGGASLPRVYGAGSRLPPFPV